MKMIKSYSTILFLTALFMLQLPLVLVWGDNRTGVVVYDLFPGASLRETVLVGADEVLEADGGQVMISVPRQSVVVVYNLNDTNIAPEQAQLLSDVEFSSLSGAQGLAYQHLDNEPEILAVASSRSDSITLFSKNRRQWVSNKILDNNNIDEMNDFPIRSPHRLSFSKSGDYLLAISQTFNEIYIFRKITDDVGQTDWVYEAINKNQSIQSHTLSRVFALDSHNKFAITSYPDDAVYQVDLSSNKISESFEKIPLDSQLDEKLHCKGPSAFLSIDVIGQYIIGCGESDSINIYQKNWSLIQIINKEQFAGSNLLDSIYDLTHYTTQENIEYLYATSPNENVITVFRYSEHFMTWEHVQTLYSSDVGLGVTGITALALPVPRIFTIASSSGDAVVMEGKGRPLFDETDYSFEYPLENTKTNNFTIGIVKIDFMSEAEVSPDHVELSDHNDLFYWVNNTLMFSSAVVNETAFGNNNWTLIITGINGRGQDGSAEVAIKTLPLPLQEATPIWVYATSAVASLFVSSAVLAITAKTIYSLLPRYKYKSNELSQQIPDDQLKTKGNDISNELYSDDKKPDYPSITSGDSVALRIESPPEITIQIQSEAITGAEPEAITETDPEAITGAEPEAITETDPEAITETDPEAITGAEPEAITETDPEAITETDPEAITETEPEAITETEPEAIAGAEPEAITETQSGAIAEAEPEAVAEAQPTVVEIKNRFPQPARSRCSQSHRQRESEACPQPSSPPLVVVSGNKEVIPGKSPGYLMKVVEQYEKLIKESKSK